MHFKEYPNSKNKHNPVFLINFIGCGASDHCMPGPASIPAPVEQIANAFIFR